MKPKVLMLLDTGDRTRFWDAILRRMAGRGADVTLATISSEGELHKVAREVGIPAEGLGVTNRAGFPTGVRRMRQLLSRLQPQVVHAHETLPALSAGIARLGRPGPRLIYHRHHGHGTARHRPVSAIAGRLADLTLAVSDSSRRHAVEEDGLPLERTAFALNGIPPLAVTDEHRIQELRHQIGIKEGELAIVVVGRLRAEKGHRYLIQAMSILASAAPTPLHLVVVGSGPMEGQLRAEAGVTPSPVHFVGHQKDIAAWASLGDIVALPSLQDACPLTALEAMSLGRPICASAVEGIPELLEDEVNALLVPPADPTSLAEALRRLATDPSLRETIGAGARTEYERRFTLDHMLDRWDRAYERVMRG